MVVWNRGGMTNINILIKMDATLTKDDNMQQMSVYH
jgi:hypothetical protein